MNITSGRRVTNENRLRWSASVSMVPLIFGIGLLLDQYCQNAPVFSDWYWTPLGEKTFGLLPPLLLYSAVFMIWRAAIVWTVRKRVVYLLAACVLVVCTNIAALPWDTMNQRWNGRELALWMVSIGLAFVVNAWAYWTPPCKQSDSDHVPCPKCGYDLRGQRECRCPECGFAFTLSEMATGQWTLCSAQSQRDSNVKSATEKS